MLNNAKERIEKRCPGCQHWGKGHVVDIATRKSICTGKLIAMADLEEVSNKAQERDEDRVLPWRDCVRVYEPMPKSGLLAKIFGRRKEKRFCLVCGRRLKAGTFGMFCGLDCATKYLDDEEQKEKGLESTDNVE